MSPTGSSRVARTLAAATVLLLALALVAGAGIYLARSQAAVGEKLRQDVVERANLTARLLGDTLDSPRAGLEEYAAALSGPESTVPALVAADTGGNGAVLFRSDGTVLRSGPADLAKQLGPSPEAAAIARTIRPGRLRYEGVTTVSGAVSVRAYTAVPGAEGRRVLMLLVQIEQVVALGKAYLSTLGTQGGTAYVVDATGKTIVSSAAGEAAVPDALAAAVRARSHGTLHGDWFASSTVPTASWRVVLVMPERAMLEPTRSSRRVAWQLFGAFAGAMLILIVSGAVALISSSRLAHARRHDALTGLPNRALLMEGMESALTAARGRGGPVAALFIDLDGFKPINDTYGHAMGDKLLKAVAERLIESMRPGDQVGRFGGDEFLVLCKDLRHEADARAVADRIRKYIAEPFDIDGTVLSVDTSIGIALADDDTAGSEALIHNADVAMYRAKQGGRGRIESFSGLG